MSVDLSIIIVSWNVKELLADCIRSILNTSNNLKIEIIVIDNASSDGTDRIIKHEFREVIFIASPKNLGFPKANNIGLIYATGKHILFLNPDTVVGPGGLEAMVKLLEERDDVGMVGCRLIKPDGTVQPGCAREFPTLLSTTLDIYGLSRIFPKNRFLGRLNERSRDYLASCNVSCIVGACMMAKRSALEEIGFYLDDRIPMYFEDIDLCYRIRKAGHKIHYLGTHAVTHYSGASTKISEKKALLDMLALASPYLFIKIHLGGRLSASLFRLLSLPASVLRLVICGFALKARFPVLGHSANQLKRDTIRAKAWLRFGWTDYELVESGSLTLED